MWDIFYPAYDSRVTNRTQRALAALKLAMDINMPEEEAIREVSETYGISPEVTQTFLEYVKEHPDPSEW